MGVNDLDRLLVIKKNKKPKKKVYKNIFTAGISSMVARTIVAPIERVEIFRQLKVEGYYNLSLISSLIKIYKNQGIFGLFKGNLSQMIRIFPFAAIEFTSMEFYKKIFYVEENRLTLFLCGFLTAFNAIIATYPLDLARTRIASNITDKNIRQSSIYKVLKELYKNNGITSWYKGFRVCFIGSLPYVTIKQTTYEILKKMTNDKKFIVNFLNGCISAGIGTTFTYPAYVLKRVLQANSKNIIYKTIKL